MLSNNEDRNLVERKTEDDKFKAYFCTYLISVFLNTIETKAEIEDLKVKNISIHHTYTRMLNYSEIWRLIEYIEGDLCFYFGVHRINLWLCNHIKNELFKVISDGKSIQQKIISYDTTKGIAKSVANDGIPIVANDAHKSPKFLREIDDPRGTNDRRKI